MNGLDTGASGSPHGDGGGASKSGTRKSEGIRKQRAEDTAVGQAFVSAASEGGSMHFHNAGSFYDTNKQLLWSWNIYGK